MDDIVEQLRESEQLFGNSPAGRLYGEAADEIERLRQAIWDAYGILGFDQDGDTLHQSHRPIHGWAQFLRDFAAEQRADYDEACVTS